MSDIFGRSTIAPTDGIRKKQISSMIKRYLTSRLNLVDVDPGEIVVFETDKGKLKTSNISFDSLLTKPKDAADDSIAVFKSGKLEPSYDIKRFSDKFDTIDNINVNTTNAVKNLAMLQSSYDSHVASFATLRRNFNTADNAIEKFFGKKNIKPDEVTTTLPDLKKSIDDIKKVTDKVKIDNLPQLDKVKIPHSANDIKSLSYVIRQELNKEYLGEHRLSWKETITGIYRFSIISEHQFNIEVSLLDDNNKVFYTTQKLNTVLLVIENKTVARLSFFIKAVDANVVRATFGCILEYVSAID